MRKSILIAALTAIASVAAYSQGVPAPYTMRFQPFITSGLSSPVFMTNAGDGTNRLFIVQQGGLISVVQPGSSTPTPFLNVTSTILSGGERGLLGLAFHPQYSTNRRFFIYYTRAGDGAIEIAEYQANATDPNVAVQTPVKTIITIPHTANANHNGATVAFGPDGYLYAGTGDGGGSNDQPANSQNKNVLLGKILRLDINNTDGQPYGIPSDNPFVGVTGADEIYAYGVRNPYRFSFDRGGTHQMWIADVGQGAWEEVDIGQRGANYGWRVFEGNHCTGNDTALCSTLVQTPPIFEYSHASGRCSITGGFVYRGRQGNLPLGSYVYADYCSGEIFLYNNNAQPAIINNSSAANVVGFGEDESGELYMIREGGPIYKIVRGKASADFDGDLKTDVSIFRPSIGDWWILNSSNSNGQGQHFGLSGDIPVPEDYDADNRTDIAAYRPSTGEWFLLRSSDGTFSGFKWGTSGDIPAAGDFDGDARADATVFRPSDGVWYTLRSSDGSYYGTRWGTSGDKPVAADYDGDGKADVAVWRPSDGNWYRVNSTNAAFVFVHWGTSGDIPAPGDFDGDGKGDICVFRPSDHIWYIVQSSTQTQRYENWGLANDIPAAGDYDADGKDDLAVYRPSTGTWFVLRSSDGAIQSPHWGVSEDMPAPAYDIP
ncbi:MAG TPA: PQQ-dependent sugar dehydrogenase [Pyrinomonadaceae bacterium]|jgi:hypothetical protein|nr:PQQ-dependent sugar dehydrogenase [Pyrinomonadaceae bacterium]